LETTSSRELTEWAQFFEWRDARQAEERQWQSEVVKAERYVKDGT
jgi:hypothetical protein